MIVIDETFLQDLDDINSLLDYMYRHRYKEEHDIGYKLYKDFILECHHADVKLQKIVSTKMSEDFVSLVVLPFRETDDLSTYSFKLVSKSGDKIKKRDEKKYYGFCYECFKNIVPFYERVLEYYSL